MLSIPGSFFFFKYKVCRINYSLRLASCKHSIFLLTIRDSDESLDSTFCLLSSHLHLHFTFWVFGMLVILLQDLRYCYTNDNATMNNCYYYYSLTRVKNPTDFNYSTVIHSDGFGSPDRPVGTLHCVHYSPGEPPHLQH